MAWLPTQWSKIGQVVGIQEYSILGVIAFATLGYSLYHFARKPLG